MEIEDLSTENAEALTETGLGYFGVRKRNGLRILQEKGTKGGDEMENAAEAAMEAKRIPKKLRFFEDLIARKKEKDDSKVETLETRTTRRADFSLVKGWKNLSKKISIAVQKYFVYYIISHGECKMSQETPTPRQCKTTNLANVDLKL